VKLTLICVLAVKVKEDNLMKIINNVYVNLGILNKIIDKKIVGVKNTKFKHYKK
jgi:hypothetical protein